MEPKSHHENAFQDESGLLKDCKKGHLRCYSPSFLSHMKTEPAFMNMNS